MLDKVLLLVGILLWSILVIENMVVWLMWYLFLDPGTNVWVIIFIAILIWIWMWYGTRWILNSKDNQDDDDNDDYNF